VKGVSAPETERGAQLVGLPKIDVPPDQRRGVRRSDLPSVGPRDAELHTAHDEQQRRRRGHRLVPDTSVGVSRDEQHDPGTGSTGLRAAANPAHPCLAVGRIAEHRRSRPRPSRTIVWKRAEPLRPDRVVRCCARVELDPATKNGAYRPEHVLRRQMDLFRGVLGSSAPARCRTGSEPAPSSPQPTSRPGPISGPGSGQPRILGRCPAAAAPRP
jgi:hypothetical protein